MLFLSSCILLFSASCFAGTSVTLQIVGELSNGIPYLTADPSFSPGQPRLMTQTAPIRLTSSGVVELVLPTTNAEGSSIDIIGILTTDSLGTPSTIFQPITETTTGTLGPETIVQLPLTDGQGSLVIATGVLTTDASGKPTTSFFPLIITNSAATGAITEIVLATPQSGSSVGYELGALSSESGGVETVIGGSMYVPQGTESVVSSGSSGLLPGTPQTSSTLSVSSTTMRSQSSSGSVKALATPIPAILTGTSKVTTSGNTPSYSLLSKATPISSSSVSTQSVTSVPGLNGLITTNSAGSPTDRSSQSSGNQIGPVSTTTGPSTGTTTGIMGSNSRIVTSGASTISASATGLGTYPSSITFLSLSNGHSVVGIAFVTTDSNGFSIITNIVPSQSAVGIGQVVISANGATTTINLSALPSATPLPSAGADQVATESGLLVTYSPITLSGYQDITQPFELSTNFVEVVNGQTTTQGGFWLIGIGGVIDPPSGRPWKIGGGLGCIGGPLFCNMPGGNVDIGGGLGIHLPDLNLPDGTVGPPGYPGGPVGGDSGDPDEPPPPYEDPDNDEKTDQDQKTTANDEKTNSDQRSTAAQTSSTIHTSSTATSRGTSSRVSSSVGTTMSTTAHTSTQSGPASVTAKYFIIAATKAAVAEINSLLEEFDPIHGPVTPDVGDTSVSGGMWIDYDLNLTEVQSISSRSDILMIQTCASVNLFPSGAPSSVYSTSIATTVSQITLSINVPSATPNAKLRRDDVKQVQGPHVMRPETRGANLEGSMLEAPRFRFDRSPKRSVAGEVVNGLARDNLIERDQGTRLVRQVSSPKDLSVLAWVSVLCVSPILGLS